MSEEYRNYFLQHASDWICDPYWVDVRYIGWRGPNEINLLAASIFLFPLAFPQDASFSVETDNILAGQVQRCQNKDEVLELLHRAASGEIEIESHTFSLLPEREEYMFSSNFVRDDQWHEQLNLDVMGVLPKEWSEPSHISRHVTDNHLRKAMPPFDGMTDLMHWLGLKDPRVARERPAISIRVLPPVDIAGECKLASNGLILSLAAHPNFDLSKASLAIRAAPGDGIRSREHIAPKIKWSKVRAGKRAGKVSLRLKNTESAQYILMIGDTVVRKDWLIDPEKAENYRLVATHFFDKDLKMVRDAFESTDSTRFELGVGALLFMLGFSSAVQPEKDAPDLIAVTPQGRIVLIECTTKISDFHSKLGKLVGRKASLMAATQDRKIPPRIEAILICATPKNQVASKLDELRSRQIPLVTKEDLYALLGRLRFHVDPDALLDEAVANLNKPEWL